MRYLEDIKIDKLKGKEFWIVGLGPSLDDYPDNFFEGKIAIGLNATFIAFPHLTYYVTGDWGGLPRLMIETDPELVKRTIWFLSTNLSSKYINHPNEPAPDLNLKFGKYNGDLIYVTKALVTNGQIELFKKVLPPIVKDTVQRKIPCHFIALRTCAHVAVLCAAYLGAKKITMVGCEAKLREHTWEAQNRGLHNAHARLNPKMKKDGTPEVTYSIDQQQGKTSYLTCFRVGAELLAKELALHGIEVRKYYYKTGYETIV